MGVSTIGRFEILRRLGEGGMGTVFEARDPELSRSVALKVLRDPASNPVRLLREAQALARLTHPNVVAVYELGAHGDEVFIAMQLVDGVTIDAYLAEHRCTWREVIALYAQAGRGLAAVHAQGLVHRDFKPSNVLVDRDGVVRVGDFGLARRDDDSAAAPAGRGAGPPPSTTAVTVDDRGATIDAADGEDATPPRVGLLASPLTAHGAVVGTPHYMAPEQLAGERVSRQADQYAFAFTVREALAPRAPPAWVGRVLARALARDPGARYPSMTALLDALAAVPRRRRRLVVAAAASVVAVGVGSAFLFARGGGADVDCARAAGALAATWNADARTALTARLEAARASDTVGPVTAGLDRWADRWRTTRVDACRATHARGEQSAAVLDARIACLDRGLAAASALLENVARLDASTARNAGPAVDALPAPEACTAARVTGTAPVDPRAAVVERVIADAEAALALRSPDVVARARGALADARALGEPGPTARALAVHARAIAGTEAARARAELDEAQALAAAARDPGLEAEVVYVAIDVATAHDTADRVEALVPALRGAIERAGSPPPLLRRLAAAEFYAAMKSRRGPEAKAACDRRAERALPEERSRVAAECQCRLAIVARDPVAAVPSCRAALVEIRAHHGANHPLTAEAIKNLVVVLGRAGKVEDEAVQVEELHRIYALLYGERSVEMAKCLYFAADVAGERGQLAEARALLERSLAISDDVAPNEAGRGGILLHLGELAGDLGDVPAAIRYAEQGLRAAEAELGPGSPEMATIWLIYARTIQIDPLGRARTLAACDQAIAIADRTPGAGPLLGSALVECALIRASFEQPREALALARRALPLHDGAGDALMAGRDQYLIGHLLLQLGQRAGARAALLDARRRLAPEEDAEYLGLIETDLSATK